MKGDGGVGKVVKGLRSQLEEVGLRPHPEAQMCPVLVAKRQEFMMRNSVVN